MFMIVTFGLIIAVLGVLFTFLVMFLSVAFEDPRKSRERREQTEVRDALHKVARVKVDPSDSSSATFGELVEQGAFGHWADQKRDVS